MRRAEYISGFSIHILDMDVDLLASSPLFVQFYGQASSSNRIPPSLLNRILRVVATVPEEDIGDDVSLSGSVFYHFQRSSILYCPSFGSLYAYLFIE